MMKAKGPASAVVDTNLVISGLIKKVGVPYEVVEAFRRGDFTLVLSASLGEEYRRVLKRPVFAQRYGLTPEAVAAFLFLVETSARWVNPRRRLPTMPRDQKDARVLAAAVGGRAEYLVTGDMDLLALKDNSALGALRIVTAREFLDVLRWAGHDEP